MIDIIIFIAINVAWILPLYLYVTYAPEKEIKDNLDEYLNKNKLD